MTETAALPSSGQPEILRADPVYRRKLFLVYGICLLAGVGILAAILPPGTRMLREMSRPEAFFALQYVFTFILLSPTPASIILIRIGMKAVRSRAYPYPGMKVIRDTRIYRDGAAIVRGRALILLGVSAIVLSIVSVVVTHQYAERLRRPVKIHFEYPASPNQGRNLIFSWLGW